MSATLIASPPEFADEWRAWHASHEEHRASEHGFLAITSIRWLGAEPERFDDAPGAWSTGESGISVELAEDESLEFRGAVLTGRHDFGQLPERASWFAYWKAPEGRAAIEIARRGGNDIVRPRHPNAPIRTAYTGTPAYEPDARFVIEGRFEAFETPRPVTVGSVVDGLQHVYEVVGTISFEFDGPHSLLAFNGQAGGLHVLFTDVTSGVTTYAANRSLNLTAPDSEGRVRLDFNRYTNLPCAYTPFATCPLPPAENRLAVAIEAGEKAPVTVEETN